MVAVSGAWHEAALGFWCQAQGGHQTADASASYAEALRFEHFAQARAAISLATELEALDQPQSDGLILLTARAARLVRVLVVTAA